MAKQGLHSQCNDAGLAGILAGDGGGGQNAVLLFVWETSGLRKGLKKCHVFLQSGSIPRDSCFFFFKDSFIAVLRHTGIKQKVKKQKLQCPIFCGTL